MDQIEYAVYGEVHRFDYETKVVTKHIHNFDKWRRKRKAFMFVNIDISLI